MKNSIIALLAVALIVGVCAASFGTEYNVGVYYYPWYGDTNFHSAPTTISAIRWYLSPAQQPTLGWYNSHDPSVVSAHYLWARSAGIDFFCCSYWQSSNGPGQDSTAQVLKNDMLTHPDTGSVKACVLFEPNVTKDNIAAEVEWLCDNVFSSPGYYRIDNKPVVFAYNVLTLSDADLATYCTNARNAASSKGYSIYLVGDEAYGILPRSSPTNSSATRCSRFDAVTFYNPYGMYRKYNSSGKYMSSSNINSIKNNNNNWKSLANGVNVSYFPCIEPGFNDSEIRGNRHVAMSRKTGSDASAEGSFLSDQLTAAKTQCDRSIIMVTSWNEWHEDSQIEPCGPVGAVTSSINSSLPVVLESGMSGSPSTGGLNYVGYGTDCLDRLRSGASDVPVPPTAPSNPGATDLTNSSIRWTWQDNSSTETSFNVFVDPYDEITTSGYTYPRLPQTLQTVSAGTTTWTSTGLEPNVLYALQVYSLNGESPSLRTTMFTSRTLAAAPSAGNNVSCDKAAGTPYPLGTVFTFSNPTGFGQVGAYNTSAFQYIWDNNPTYTFIGSEQVWSGGEVSQTPTTPGNHYLHLRSVNHEGAVNPTTLDYGPFVIPDITPPTSSVTPSAGAYKAPLAITLSATEAAAIYYTVDGNEPTTASDVYTAPLEASDDLILRFFAVDTAGNVESTIHEEVYWMISGSDTIGDVRNMTSATPVRLADKVLFWKSGTSGYIEEANRSSAIRVVSDPENPLTAFPAVGTVYLAGTLNKTTSDCYITLDVITPAGGAMDIKPLGASNAALKKSMMNALYVKAYGKVQTGSITSNSFVINDGSDTTGIKVMFTAGQVTVSEGQYVSVIGAMGGTSSQPVLYLMSLLSH